VPWTVFWERNYFLEATRLGEVLTSHPVRGAVSGLGAVCLAAALHELTSLWPRRANAAASPEQGPRA
jgi:hypothetical protein